MSSSRRSSRSSRSNPSWRSVSVSQSSAPTISLVFGQPEQGAPLAAAISKLPASKVCEIASLNGSMMGTSIHDETKEIREEEESSEQAHQDLEPVITAPPVPVASDALSIPSPSPEVDSNLRSSPGGSSWFGSLSRAKGKPKVDKILEIQQEPTVETTPGPPVVPEPPSPVVQVQPPTPPKPLTESKAEPLPIPIKNKRSWFSSTSSSPVAAPVNPPQSPRPPNVGHNTSNSIDEEVPTLSTVVFPPPAQGTVLQSISPDNDGVGHGRVRTLSSLNPSTSRFTLSIPLLGRPKIPLDKAVAVAQQDGNVDASANVTEQTITTTTTVTTTETVSDSVPTTSTSAPNMSSSSSWWGYIGWSAPEQAQSPSTKIESFPSGSSPTVETSSTIVAEPLPPPPAADLALASSPTPTPTNPTSIQKQKVNPNPPPASIRSSATQSSGWYSYSPWGWYGGYSAEDIGTASDAGQKTESERIKEEALARAEAVVEEITSASLKPPEMSTSKSADSYLQSNSNPIESTITTNVYGWASFFSSRTLGAKLITESETKKDENGMEVMDIDEDDPSTTTTTTDKTKLLPPPPSPKPQTTTKHKSVDNKTKPPPPLTIADSVKRETSKANKRKSISPAPSPIPSTPPRRPPNLVLPTWADTFHAPPRNLKDEGDGESKLTKTMKFVSGVLFARDEEAAKGKGKGKARERSRERELLGFGRELPRAWDIIEAPRTGKESGKGKVNVTLHQDVLRGCTKVVVIGIHGWFPGAVMRSVLGEPTGTSSKFVSMMVQALEEFQEKHNVKLEKITTIPLEGEGTIDRRVDKLYNSMLSNQSWMDDLHGADAIFVATHSQGSVVSTHLLDRLIRDKHIRTSRNTSLGAQAVTGASTSSFSAAGIPAGKPQKICCLALCGIHLGPLRYLSTSSLLQPYIQYFESTAARELFEFQNTESQVSKAYVEALRNVVDNGTKMVYVASLNDQVVPLYSGLFTAVSHPLILRALYIDGDAYNSSDFLSNLLVLLLRVLNSGLSDSGLLAHLSEATAGSLNGVGHSTAYEELATYSLAVNYLFLTDDGRDRHPELTLEPFNATHEQNDYEIPWSLRDLIADPRVLHLFARDIIELRDAFREWHPRTTILRDIKRKLQPIQRLPSSISSDISSVSKL